MASPSLVESAKLQAACQAVDNHVTPGVRRLGVGSGSTIVYAIERLKENRNDLHPDLVCIPTSFQSRMLLIEAGFRVGDLDEFPELDLAIDGADEIDAQLNAIKGGGAAHLREKVVAAAARSFILIADHRKDSKTLGEQWKKGIPIEVIPFAYNTVKAKIEQLADSTDLAKGAYSAPAPRAHLRMATAKAGPVVTDSGNLILDADFGLIRDPLKLLGVLKMLPGVVEVGLFCGMANKAYFGLADGSTTCRMPC
ncbi:ribose-5-phosphate isomerase rki1 [Dimargaris verticillata]|uniref:Ribose-5-phosphate isomerase n=1 Tax=Dimargaris verticillata TaxID=2761393 RepID=A0A9W8B6N2_9FUNG|nr:ribose-5-phosphate isomerase rki1 [Dimargaris verticillata]